jgi:hypothetical protein
MTTIRYRRDLWRLTEGYPGDAAEIGVAEGFFSADILRMPVNFPIVYMVDRWACFPGQKGDGGHPQDWHDANYKAAVERVKSFGSRAKVLRGDSKEMAFKVPPMSLRLVYIDCDHSYEGVMGDICAWLPKLLPGGVMAFHDFEMPQYGVKRAVEEFCKNRYQIHYLPEDRLEDAGAYFIC